ncbi:hypothetical protein D1007_17263 [Hordeum vulgare]|nr:hypothetical protein D1007_17263 [Hordeum vulgare]
MRGFGGNSQATQPPVVPNGYNVVPAIPHSYLSEKVVFPPFRIRNVRDAKKAAADATSGSYGKASISHGSFNEDGNLQVGFFSEDGILQFY